MYLKIGENMQDVDNIQKEKLLYIHYNQRKIYAFTYCVEKDHLLIFFDD